jgi:hypothetical protein
MYTLFPEIAIGAAILSLPKSEDKAVADGDCCVRNEDAADTRVVATRDIHKEIPKTNLGWFTEIYTNILLYKISIKRIPC